MDRLPKELKEKVLSNLNPRDMVRAGGTSRALRDASHTEFHNLLNNEHVTRLAERYKSKLLVPRMTLHDEAPTRVAEVIGQLPERNEFGRPTQFRPDGDRTFAGRQMKRSVDDDGITDQLGRPIDRGR
jgi:hypothetical protein